MFDFYVTQDTWTDGTDVVRADTPYGVFTFSPDPHIAYRVIPVVGGEYQLYGHHHIDHNCYTAPRFRDRSHKIAARIPLTSADYAVGDRVRDVCTTGVSTGVSTGVVVGKGAEGVVVLLDSGDTRQVTAHHLTLLGA